MILCRLAWRNIGRNRRRTVITALALAVGTSLCVVSYGLTDGMRVDIIHALTRYDLGHLQIHHKDYPRRKSLNLTIPNPDLLVEKLRNEKSVRSVSKRVYGQALLSHGEKSAGTEFVGVGPKDETHVTELHKMLIKGDYLDMVHTPWPMGQTLSEQEKTQDEKLTQEAVDGVLDELDNLESLGKSKGAQKSKPIKSLRSTISNANNLSLKLAKKISPMPLRPPKIVIGAKLAKRLKTKVGDHVRAMCQTVDGMMAEVRFVITGIFSTGTEYLDHGRVYIHIKDLQRFLHLYNQVHEITVLTNDADKAPALAKAVKVILPTSGIVIRDWATIRPDIKRIMDLNDVSMIIMVLIIFLVAILGVVNTMLMSVFERTRELGMLKAIGMSQMKIVWLIVIETAILVLVSAAIGTFFGFGMDLYLVRYGIDLQSVASEGMSLGGVGLSPVLHAAITLKGLLLPMLVLGLCCFVASFYPAVRAARMQPAIGMRDI
ncbi:MAG: FtsX-like permease family protein [Pseudomonadota bacterium]